MRTIRTIRTKAVAAALLGLLLVAGCSKTSSQQPSAPSAGPPVKIDPATAASIEGTVFFSGAAPKPRPIDMSQDTACKGQNVFEPYAVTDGRLANVFVYVKVGLPSGSFPVPADPVVINQRGCRYEPHVAAVQVGQRLRILNSDDTTHNVHPMPQHNHEWNASQAPGGEPIEKKFTAPEMMIPVQCNAHPWMRMYLNVADNPFFAVTGSDGRYAIRGLPPGSYTVAAVHESGQTEAQTVSIGPRQAAQANFTMRAADAASVSK